MLGEVREGLGRIEEVGEVLREVGQVVCWERLEMHLLCAERWYVGKGKTGGMLGEVGETSGMWE